MERKEKERKGKGRKGQGKAKERNGKGKRKGKGKGRKQQENTQINTLFFTVMWVFVPGTIVPSSTHLAIISKLRSNPLIFAPPLLHVKVTAIPAFG